MTSSGNRTRATRRLAAGLRWGGAAVAAVALVALGLVNSSTAARAASTPSGYDQMSGTGNTASAITVPWTDGLRGLDNQALTTPGGELNPNADREVGIGSYGFMTDGFTGTENGNPYKDAGAFNKITVKVSQTQDIGHAGITVSWTGGLPTNEAQAQGGFMQIMECYGNSPDGPSPEDCEFGQGKSPVGNPDNSRGGFLCSSDTLGTTNPTGSMDGGPPSAGCDPLEPTVPAHGGCGGGVSDPDCPDRYNIPFDPVSGSTPLYETGNQLNPAFDQFGTNEVDFATTDSAGNGQQQFETVTNAQSSGLGCGKLQADGTPQGCWLVIVPRGVYEPNGYNVLKNTTTSSQVVSSSPLSAGNWAQRIQIHLDYAPLPTFCQLGAPGTAESLMEGSQLVTRAVQSWELKLNQDTNCKLIYHDIDSSEQQVTADFTSPLSPDVAANGLAFTTAPVGDDRVRAGELHPTLPKIVYAPVAVMALDFGFHIDVNAQGNYPGGYLSTPVKLSPQVVARALTQTYRKDIPDFDTNGNPPEQGPIWSQKNPVDMSADPDFEKLNGDGVATNDGVPLNSSANAIAPLDTVDHGAYYQQIWNWMQADPSTKAWLGGASNSTVKVDPDYESQQLGKTSGFDSMPRSYPCVDLHPSGGPSNTAEQLCSIDMLPYVLNFDAASAAVLTGNPNQLNRDWDPGALAPNGDTGYFGKAPVEVPGQTWIWAVDATPYTAAYGIVPAELCGDNSDSNCIAPTAASVTAAVNHAKPDSDGLLQVNPASPGSGAYPLTEVIYAAVRADMPPQQLTDYANFISYATSQGQTPGQAGGDLPPGYLPLTASLQAKANAAVATLRSIAAGGPTSTGTPTTSSSSSSSSSSASPSATGPSTGAPATDTSGTQPTAATSTTPAVTPNPSAGNSAAPNVSASGATPTGPVIVPPTVQLAAGDTPAQPVGPIRQVLVVVIIIGVAGAGGGILLRRGRMPRWPGRSRP